MKEEALDIVNEEDEWIGQESRSTVHQRGLWHRGVHILLFTRDGRMLVQQRSKDRAHSPSTLDCSVSEHLKAGEGYPDAAVRGLAEELGVAGIELQPLIKFKMNYGPNDNEISTIFKGLVEPSQVRFDPVEIERIGYYTLTELQELLRNEPARFSYWFRQILLWHLGKPSDLFVLQGFTK